MSDENDAAPGRGLRPEDTSPNTNERSEPKKARGNSPVNVSAADFLGNLLGQDTVFLVAMKTDGGPVDSLHVSANDSAAIEGFVARQDGRNNLYWTPNRVRFAFQELKPAASDIEAIRFVCADLDPPDAGDADTWRDDTLAILRTLRCAPTANINSGRGLQVFWRLGQDVDPSETTKHKRVSEAIATDLHGDKVSNVDRLMRLPGTTNLASATKRAKGFPAGSDAYVIASDGPTYTLSELEAHWPGGDPELDNIVRLPPPPAYLQNDDKNLGNENVLPEDCEPELTAPTLEEVDTLLSSLDASCSRDDWIRIGMSIQSAYPGEEGFDIWHDWSSTGTNYKNERDCRTAWRSFSEDHPDGITIATLIAMAKEASAVEISDAEFERFLIRYVYVRQGNRVADLEAPPSASVMEIAEFRNQTANVWVHGADGNLVLANKHWLRHPGRLDSYDTDYRPGGNRLFSDERDLVFINEFELPDHEETAETDRLGVLTDHLDYIIPDEDERVWFTNWLAMLVQHPERRGVVPLHIATPHGTGRGWLVELIKALLGSWNCSHVKMEVLSGKSNAGQYQDFLHNTLMCVVPEVHEGKDRFEISDRVRDVISDPTLEVNRKYGRKRTRRVFTSFMFQSNHWDGLVIKPEDRRIQVIGGPEWPNEPAYYVRLYSWLEDRRNIAQAYRWLMRRNLSGWGWQRSTATKSRERLIGATMSETEKRFRQLLEDLPAKAATFFQVKKAVQFLGGDDEGLAQFDENDRQIQALLRTLCQRPLGNSQLKMPKEEWDSKKVRPWQLVAGQALSNDQLKTEIIKFNNWLDQVNPGWDVGRDLDA